ncbi:MAG: molybdopterin-dependent oxidoreductase [Actinobacteria bacterium]|nr:molybdopterin-dependent oxidoreductase [Actinomycetota bacterium]
MVLPGMLHAVMVRSPVAHARIESVDTSAASRVDGFVTVLTGADLMSEWAGPLPMIWPVADGILLPDHWPVAPAEVKHAGDPVAVVVAESRAAAEDAAELVGVEYDVLDAVVDMEAALEPDAPLVHEELGTNRCFEAGLSNGDVDRAFREAAVTVSERFVQQRVIPSPMETRAVIAVATPGTGELTLWSSTQVPHILKAELAGCVGVPEHNLRVIAPDVGGGFGAKLNVYGEEAAAVVLARRLGRPIKWVEERSEHSLATSHGRGQVQYVEIAADADGKIRGIRSRIVASMGAYLLLETPGIPMLGKFLHCGVYGADAYSFDCVAVFTNQTPTDAYRGAGRPEASYAIERAIDALGRRVGVDPAEIRRRNLLPPGEWVTNAAGIEYDSLDVEPTLDEALRVAGYEDLRREQARRRKQGGTRLLGIGLSCYVESCGVGPSRVLAKSNYQAGGWEAARVRILGSGKVEVVTGVSPHGQGHETVLSQIAADRLGVPMEDVAVLHGDTAVSAAGLDTYGSRSLVVGGTAVLKAADRVLSKARALAAHLLEASEEDLLFEDGEFSISGAPERALGIAAVARAAHLGQNLPETMEPGLEEQVVYDPPEFTYPFGTHVAVVEVDVETGSVELLRFVAVDDCGNVVNPMIVEGQAHGGLAHGIAQALYEEAVYSQDGQLQSGSLMSYLVPSAAELPSFEVSRKVTPSPVNPLGAKGAGEAGTIGSAQAVMNAVVDALAPLGVTALDMPASPARVWAAIREAGRG